MYIFNTTEAHKAHQIKSNKHTNNPPPPPQKQRMKHILHKLTKNTHPLPKCIIHSQTKRLTLF